MKLFYHKLFFFIFLSLITFFAEAGIYPVVRSSAKGLWVQIQDSNRVVFSSLKNDAGLMVVQPIGTTEVRYNEQVTNNGILNLKGGRSTGLEISESYKKITPGLIERTVTVKAKSDQRYYIDFGWKTMQPGEFYSFTGEEKTSVKYAPGPSGPEFGENKSLETFTFLGLRNNDKLYGLIGDTPGMWENLSFLYFDKENKNLSLCNGDGSVRRTITF
ncbi:MAG: hypothetical protein Q8904_13275, partial [Bacteroidota bacterium]|nr:hypothetical protein [Bacteroidota bacterium]